MSESEAVDFQALADLAARLVRRIERSGTLELEDIARLRGAEYMEGVKLTRVRRLTPRECWRLMGFSDEDYDRAEAVQKEWTQLYMQAGNSIVKQVLMAIFRQMNIDGVERWDK